MSTNVSTSSSASGSAESKKEIKVTLNVFEFLIFSQFLLSVAIFCGELKNFGQKH